MRALRAATSETETGLLAKAAAYFPGGVLGRHLNPFDPSHVLSHGRAGHVFDFAGNEYIDYTCGGGALLLGYDHLGVVKAVGRQIARSSNFISVLNEPAVEYAAEICEVVPCAELLRFVGSGAEATFFALRLARPHTGRDKVLKFEGAYHGAHDYAMWSYSPAVLPDFPEPVPDTAGMPRSIKADMLVAPYNDLERTKKIAHDQASDIAAIIVEPAQRQVPPAEGFLQGIKDLCLVLGAVFILDETVTGFRLALGGAQRKYDVLPDLAVYGKTLGGGLPLAALVGSREVMGLCDPLRWRDTDDGVFVSSTLGGNPVACAAGRAFLKALREGDRYPSFHALCEVLKDGLRDSIARRGIEAQVMGEGPMWQMVFSTDEIVDYRTSLSAGRERAMGFDKGLLEAGVYLRPGGPHYFSMAHSEDDVAATVEIADGVLARMS